jgi:hypothetical protein
MPDTASLYETDWYAWTQDQAARLRDLPAALRPNGLDLEHLAEEVEDMGKAQRRTIESLLRRLLHHLLKLEFHPAAEPRRHWQREVAEFRSQLEDEFESSPSLYSRRSELARHAWKRALRDMREDLRLDDAPTRIQALLALFDQDEPHYAMDEQALKTGWYPAPHDS